ncbi:MAG TPA: SRPBCC family protein [Longimicrobiales bacterium]|nr:SRPBCC family protein [Longimicrobiales bacterium]
MKVEDRVYVEAPAGVVWRVTVDVERWPDWTPTVRSVARVDEGELGVGSVARIEQPGQPESEWVVRELEAGKRFVWETRRRGLRMVATHELSPRGRGTANLLRLDASGPVAVLLWPVLGVLMRRALTRENAGLKRHCERIAGHPRDEGAAS